MKRRSAIKTLSIAFGGLMVTPAWAKNWSPKILGETAVLTTPNEAILAEIVETLIPETTTPGAKSLQVHQFIQRMVYDCYGDDAVKLLTEGVKATDDRAQKMYNQSFVACNAAQRKDTFLQMEKDDTTKAFAKAIKDLTITGYTNSEYYLQNLTDYSMAPGFYHGCVPVKN